MADNKIALITGCARRIGAAIANSLHSRGYTIAIHYNKSKADAIELAGKLNQLKQDSAQVFHADLQIENAVKQLGSDVIANFGRLDALVNNASIYPTTPTHETVASTFEDLFRIHMLAPYQLTTALASYLSASKGAVVNMTDIYAKRPSVDNAVYSATKAGLESLTASFALQLAPNVRVNAVAPGLILWPQEHSPNTALLNNTPLERSGSAAEIAKTVEFLVCDATFMTGQTLIVDGGRTVTTP